MRVHHLNCVSACPLGGLLMDGMSAGSLRGRLTSHCLLLEAANSLVLVDTGYGMQDVAFPRARLNAFFLALVKPELRQEMTALRQIEALGYSGRDVRHIVLSHLDFDHAGGLDDFPHATVHLLSDEVASATAQKTLLDRMRYRPQQWGTRELWRSYPSQQGEPWFGLRAVRELAGLSSDVLMIPLVGHTFGHAGIAVKQSAGWLLYAADAYFYHAEMDLMHPRCTPGLRFYQTMMEKDRSQRLSNQGRLRELRAQRSEEVTIFCAHDVTEFERLAGRSHYEPASGSAELPPVPVSVAPADVKSAVNVRSASNG
jgi:glyoxylase-like metal-dependent hydrolase (beta-lactamase superfamily II)